MSDQVLTNWRVFNVKLSDRVYGMTYEVSHLIFTHQIEKHMSRRKKTQFLDH